MATGFGVRIKKLSDVEAYWPAFRKAWPAIKAECATSQRAPKHVHFSDEPRGMMPNDDSCALRFAVDIETGKVLARVHVSCGESALMNRGQEKAIAGVPEGALLVSCEWNDYHRTFSMEIQSAPGAINQPIAAPARAIGLEG